MTEEQMIERLVDAYSVEQICLALAELGLLTRLVEYLDLDYDVSEDEL